MLKKPIKLFYAFLVVLFGCVLLPACDDHLYPNTAPNLPPATNTPAVQTWQEAYTEFLREHIQTDGIDIDALPEGSEEQTRLGAFMAGGYPAGPFFYIHDIDKNGTPELVFIDPVHDYDGDVYTFTENSITKLGSVRIYPFGGLGIPLDKQNGLYSDVGYKGNYGEVLYYTIENGTIVSQLALEYNNQPDASPDYAGGFYDHDNFDQLDFYEVTEDAVIQVLAAPVIDDPQSSNTSQDTENTNSRIQAILDDSNFKIDEESLEIQTEHYEYINEDTLSDISVDHLQISGHPDPEIEQSINRILTDMAGLQDISPTEEGLLYKMQCDYYLIAGQYLNARYYLQYYSQSAAHPWRNLDSITLDLKTGNEVVLSEIIVIDERFKHKLVNRAFDDNQSDVVGVEEGVLEDCNYEDFYMQISTYEQFTLSENSIGLVVGVPHAVGDYWVLLFPYDSVRELLTPWFKALIDTT